MALQHTATGTIDTIWTPVPQVQFAKRVKQVLDSCKNVPEEPKTHDRSTALSCHGDYQLPPSIEYQLVQDLAFISANEESVHTVSAVTVEETKGEDSLCFNVAANSGVRPCVKEALIEIGRLLEKYARREIRAEKCSEFVFSLVVRLCEKKIASRLRCKDWIPPGYYRGERKGPIHQDLKKVIDRYGRSYSSSHEITQRLSALQDFVHFIGKADRDEPILTFDTRREALRLAGKVCVMKSSLESVCQRAGLSLNTVDQKTVRAFDKLANYSHISERLPWMVARTSCRSLFKSINFKFLDCYCPQWVIARELFVHAEVQLVTFHRIYQTYPLPRSIGTSKAACYLCNLFLDHHPQYRISATHGSIFEAWTVPDVTSYSNEDRKELRNIIRKMNGAMEARTKRRNTRFLQFPIQSGIYHAPSLTSLAGTIFSPQLSAISDSYVICEAEPTTLDAVALVEDNIPDLTLLHKPARVLLQPLDETGTCDEFSTRLGNGDGLQEEAGKCVRHRPNAESDVGGTLLVVEQKGEGGEVIEDQNGKSADCKDSDEIELEATENSEGSQNHENRTLNQESVDEPGFVLGSPDDEDCTVPTQTTSATKASASPSRLTILRDTEVPRVSNHSNSERELKAVSISAVPSANHQIIESYPSLVKHNAIQKPLSEGKLVDKEYQEKRSRRRRRRRHHDGQSRNQNRRTRHRLSTSKKSRRGHHQTNRRSRNQRGRKTHSSSRSDSVLESFSRMIRRAVRLFCA